MTAARSCWYIATAGPMGSGKTTVARMLARRLGWAYVPEAPPAIAYLEDLFKSPERWAFEAQASFLVHKATQALALLHGDRDIVMDRTLYEDIAVFAARFKELGYFDERMSATYDALAHYFLEEIGPPDLTIYCECPYEVAQQRRGERGRAIDSRYPAGHVQMIWNKTKDWADGYTLGPFATLDTSVCDVRDGSAGGLAVVTDVATLLSHADPDQLALFPDVPGDPSRPTVLSVRGISAIQPRGRQSPRLSRAGALAREGPSPMAYIAAPFSAITTINTDRAANDALFELTALHGTIEKGPYRNMLEAVARKLRAARFVPMLPHRDINKWGARNMTPGEVVKLCTEHVFRSNLFVGILGESHGSHYEFGLAHGMNIPAIVISCAELRASFIASGINSSMSRVLRLECKGIADIPSLLDTEAFRLFAARCF